MLARLLRIPAELRDPHVRADRHRAAAGVLVRLQRGVDAEVRLADVGGQDARIARARRRGGRRTRPRPRRSGPAATDGWNWSVGAPAASTLSLTTTGVDQVLPPSVDWVNFTSICPVPVPVLVGEVEVAGIGRARREALGDAVTEAGVRQVGGRNRVTRYRNERRRTCARRRSSGRRRSSRLPPFGGNETTAT